MKNVPLATLQDKIIRPGFEERLRPLLRYKGNQSLGRLHRMWNLVISGMAHEATAPDITQRLVMNEEYSQLCVPDRRVSHVSLASFASRVWDNPSVLAEAPGLGEYLDWIIPWYKRVGSLDRLSDPPEGFADAVANRPISWASREYGVTREIAERWFRELGLISLGNSKPGPQNFGHAARGKSLGWAVEKYDVGYAVARRWFEEAGLEPVRTRTTSSPSIVYPFLIHDGGKPEHALLRKVNAAVPMGLEPSLRADMCQDLVVAILAGEISEDDIMLPSKELSKRIWATAPARYQERSIDEVIADENFSLLDTLADEGRDWA